MKDMFGIDITPAEAKVLLGRKGPQPNGYARRPGTGPEGETCGSCRHLARKHMSKTYLKCWRNHARWTGGRGSDVLARAPACELWEAPPLPAQDAGE